MDDIGIGDWKDVKKPHGAFLASELEPVGMEKEKAWVNEHWQDRPINKSGIQPIEYKVLVLPDVLSDETVGGILKPGRVKDIEQAAAVRGYLVAVGGKAFEDFGEPTPWIGVRVQYAKYSGVHEVPGADGKSYILCNDKDIAAIINKEELLITRDGNYRFKPEKATYEREEIENETS